MEYLVRTRYTKRGLLINIFNDLFSAIVFGILLLLEPPSSRGEFILPFFIFFISFSILFAGSVNREFGLSDCQYLCMLPIDKRELRKAMYLFSFIFDSVFYFTSLVLPIVALGLPGIVVGLLLYIMLGSLGNLISHSNFMCLLRLMLVGLAISAYFHFPYSFLSMFVYPNDYFSYIILSAFSLSFLVLSLRTYDINTTLEDKTIRKKKAPKASKGSKKRIHIKFPHIKFPNIIRAMPRLRKNVQRTEMYVDFTKMSPRRAIIFMGSSYSSSLRKYHWYRPFMGARIMVIVSFIIWLTNNPALVPPIIVKNIGILLPIESLLAAGSVVVISYIGRAFKDEPIWLSFSLIDPVTYVRHYILGKFLSIFLMFLPLAVALFFIPKGLVSGMLALSIPFIYIATAPLYLGVPHELSLDLYYKNYLIDTKTFILGLLPGSIILAYVLLAGFSISFYSMFLVELSLVLLLVPLTVSVFLLYDKKFWKKIVKKMVENESL